MESTIPIVDVWMQHLSRQCRELPMFASLRRWTRHETPYSDMPLEATRSAMDEAGVQMGLLSAWWGPHGSLIGNDAVACCVQRYPDRFIGIAAVDLFRPMEAIREVRRCVGALGMRGVRILPWLWQVPPDDRRYYPLYETCVDLNIPCCLHVGYTGPLCPSEPGRPLPYLDHVVLEFPELTIVVGPIGYPWTAEMIALATKYPHVYIDTSAYTSRRYPREFVAYRRGHGHHKVLFGSHYPMLTPRACLHDLAMLALDEETTRLFLAENAAGVCTTVLQERGQ